VRALAAELLPEYLRVRFFGDSLRSLQNVLRVS
jgi:hypothetical protein